MKTFLSILAALGAVATISVLFIATRNPHLTPMAIPYSEYRALDAAEKAIEKLKKIERVEVDPSIQSQYSGH